MVEAPDALHDGRTERLRRAAQDRLTRLENGRRTGPFVAVGKRFSAIDGGVYGALMAIELFTTVLPLMILGFGYFSGFASNASVGTIFVRQLNLTGTNAETVRTAFGSSKALQSQWTVIGLAGWLIWGIPMSITVAGMFAKAWRREQFSMVERFVRGAGWFVLYLVTLVLRQRVAFGLAQQPGPQIPLYLLSLIPVWLFWSVTPAILVRDGAHGKKKYLAGAGLAGVIIDGFVFTLGSRIAFPMLLSGWTVFGPIGVAMAVMSWCGVLGFGWVIIACFSAVLWERSAPLGVVAAAESGA